MIVVDDVEYLLENGMFYLDGEDVMVRVDSEIESTDFRLSSDIIVDLLNRLLVEYRRVEGENSYLTRQIKYLKVVIDFIK